MLSQCFQNTLVVSTRRYLHYHYVHQLTLYGNVLVFAVVFVAGCYGRQFGPKGVGYGIGAGALQTN